MTKIPPVRPGCGQCENCRYLKAFRPEIVTSMIAPDRHEKVLKNWQAIQDQHPCTGREQALVAETLSALDVLELVTQPLSEGKL
jgi:hypothetical protein